MIKIIQENTDQYSRNGYEDTYIVSWRDSDGHYRDTLVRGAQYAQQAIDKIKDKYGSIYVEILGCEEVSLFTSPSRIRSADELKEDTIKKSNGKWTNRGDDGKEHGEFDTKKEADAQRRAMFANGYKESYLNESYYSISISELNDIRDRIDDLIEEMDNSGVSELSPSPNTYGMTNFIGTSKGFLNLDNLYSYLGFDESCSRLTEE